MHKTRLTLAAFSCILAGSASTHAAGTSQFPQSESTSGSTGWRQFNYDFAGTRYNRQETTLSPANVAGLKIKWQYATAGSVNGTPAVADGMVYAGDDQGFMYALTTAGALVWKTQVKGKITASAAVVGPLLVFGDLSGNLYGLRRDTGAIVWTTVADTHPFAAIFSSPAVLGPFVAIGVSSTEEDATKDPTYHCCSFRGSLLLLNALNGHVIWKTYTVSAAEAAAGSSGAPIWSTPTFDVQTQTIFVTTGNNYSTPATTTSDAFIAIDAFTGAIKWVNQRVPNDTWNARFPFTPGSKVDADIGDSPQVYTLPSGQRVVGAGGKTGFYHVLDAHTGALVNQIQVEPAGTIGGLFSDSAVANGVVFANGINWPGDSSDRGVPPTAGDLIAISGDGSKELWRFTTPGSPDLSGVAVANGVVYYASSFSGKFIALNAATGAPLAAISYGVGISGPAVVDGQVYVGAGINYGGFAAPGSVTAFGL